jgi:hypothetical protein
MNRTRTWTREKLLTLITLVVCIIVEPHHFSLTPAPTIRRLWSVAYGAYHKQGTIFKGIASRI